MPPSSPLSLPMYLCIWYLRDWSTLQTRVGFSACFSAGSMEIIFFLYKMCKGKYKSIRDDRNSSFQCHCLFLWVPQFLASSHLITAGTSSLRWCSSQAGVPLHIIPSLQAGDVIYGGTGGKWLWALKFRGSESCRYKNKMILLRQNEKWEKGSLKPLWGKHCFKIF